MPDYDVAVIGAGPGGYVAAIRAAQLGLRSVIVERDRVGGLCLNWGCIPSKALLYNAEVVNLLRRASEFGAGFRDLTLDLGVAVDRSRDVVERFVGGVETLLEQNKVRLVRGAARIDGPNSVSVSPEGEVLDAANIIVATGGAPRLLPGVVPDGGSVITSREALELRRPPASIVIVGGGAIGVEFAYFYRSYGAEVTLVEMMPRLLPAEDADLSRQLERSFTAQGVKVRTGARVEGVEVESRGATVTIRSGDTAEILRAEKVLVGVGFGASSGGLGLEEVGVELEDGWVKVDDYCRTSVPSIWAAGDVTGRLLLAHVASRQGVTAVETIAGRSPPPLDYETMPRAVFCQPQVAALGLTEAQAKERGIDVRTARFPFRANGKALAMGEGEGFVKLVADGRTDQVIGYHAIGHNATELLGEAALGALLEVTPAEIAAAVHAHPTLSEALQEAALAVNGEAVHFYTRRRS